MRSPFGIRSGLSRWHELMGSVAVIDAYAVAGFSPAFVADFRNDYYRTGGSVSTFDDALTHARSGNATMVDSDGLLKWGPHNLLTYSEDLTNSDWIVSGAASKISATEVSFTASSSDALDTGLIIPSTGARYTLEIELSSVTDAGELVNFGANLNGQSNSFSPDITLSDVPTTYSLSVVVTSAIEVRIRVRNSSDSLAKTVVVSRARIYRSDLGGMVDNPDRGDTYVPTTSAARYLPRRGNHVYNGTSWVNEGVLIESKTPARVNLETQSQSLSNYTAGTVGCTVVAEDADRADFDQMGLLTKTAGGAVYSYGVILSASGTQTFSVWLKSGTISGARIQIGAASTGTGVYADVDMGAGTIGSSTLAGGSFTAVASTIEVYPSGWVRASVTAVCPATNYVGYVIPLAASLGDTLYLMAPQFEAASTPSSYIPTSGNTVTRAADTLTAASANLPWPTPVVIGEELVTNGTFTGSADGWTLGGSSVYNNNAVNINIPSVTVAVEQTGFTPVIGKVYQISFEISNYATGGLRALWGGYSTPFALSNGLFSHVFVAASTSSALTFINGGSAFTGTIDNISVREINPLAVSIQMDGTMTYADEGNYLTVVPFRWYLDNTASIFTDVTTNSTDEGRVRFLQEAGNVVDVVQTTGSYYSPGINVPFNIASRHGSTFINGAVDGTALTVDPDPTALPDLSATDMSIGYDYMGNIGQVRIWADDLGDTGIATATIADNALVVGGDFFLTSDGEYFILQEA